MTEEQINLSNSLACRYLAGYAAQDDEQVQRAALQLANNPLLATQFLLAMAGMVFDPDIPHDLTDRQAAADALNARAIAWERRGAK